MTKPNEFQGYFPRISDFRSSLRDEAKAWGYSVSQTYRDFRDSSVDAVLGSVKWKSALQRPRIFKKNPFFVPYIKNTSDVDNGRVYPHAMDRTPLAYAFLSNPEAVNQMFDDWIRGAREGSILENNTPHYVAYERSREESTEHAAHLDLALTYGAQEWSDLSAMVSPLAHGHSVPLAGYLAHLRLRASHFVDVADVYYGWSSDFRTLQLRHNDIGLGFSRATSHEGYPLTVEKWAGLVAPGTELAWELFSLKWQYRVDNETWRASIEDYVEQGTSASQADRVFSKCKEFNVARNIILNDIDFDLIEEAGTL